jgi:acetyl-CoA decarbonylase/synthase complex subunit alpha
VRGETDLPIAKREGMLKMLEDEQDWKIDWKRKKIIEGPMRKYEPGFDPTNLPRLIRKKEEA